MRSVLFFLIVVFSTFLFAQSDMEKGLDWYNRRAEGAKASEAKAGPINRALEYFEAVLSNTNSDKAALMLMKALYFKGEYTTDDNQEKKMVFDKGKRLGEEYVTRYPESVEFRYWYLVNLGSWSKAYGILTAAREGVADLMKKHSEVIIELDPEYENGGGYFLLGAVHFQSPYIPFLLSWPDNDDAIFWLKKAVETGNPRPVQMIYLARALHKKGLEEEAIVLLEKVVVVKPNPDYLVEHLEKIEEAQHLLKEYR